MNCRMRLLGAPFNAAQNGRSAPPGMTNRTASSRSAASCLRSSAMTPRISYAVLGLEYEIALNTLDEPWVVPDPIYVRMLGFVMLECPQPADVRMLPFVGF